MEEKKEEEEEEEEDEEEEEEEVEADTVLQLNMAPHEMRPEDLEKLAGVFYDFYSVGEHLSSGYLVTTTDTHAVVRITPPGGESAARPEVFYCRNQWGKHAERVVIEALEERLRRRPPPPSTPCQGSAGGPPSQEPPPSTVQRDASVSDPPSTLLSATSSAADLSSSSSASTSSSPLPGGAAGAVSVDLFINHSPCQTSECCQALVDFRDQHPDVTLSVIFSSLYNVNRPSCKSCYHRKAYPVNRTTHKTNRTGLRLLMAPGSRVIVRPFSEDDWRFLSSVLPLERKTDHDMGVDLMDLGGRRGAGDAATGDHSIDDTTAAMSNLQMGSPTTKHDKK